MQTSFPAFQNQKLSEHSLTLALNNIGNENIKLWNTIQCHKINNKRIKFQSKCTALISWLNVIHDKNCKLFQ